MYKVDKAHKQAWRQGKERSNKNFEKKIGILVSIPKTGSRNTYMFFFSNLPLLAEIATTDEGLMRFYVQSRVTMKSISIFSNFIIAKEAIFLLVNYLKRFKNRKIKTHQKNYCGKNKVRSATQTHP